MTAKRQRGSFEALRPQSFPLLDTDGCSLAAETGLLTGKLLLSHLDQLAGDVTPDAAGVFRKDVPIIAVLGKSDTKGLRDFVLHLVERLVRLGNDQLIVVGHYLHLLAVGSRIVSVSARFMIGKPWKTKKYFWNGRCPPAKGAPFIR